MQYALWIYIFPPPESQFSELRDNLWCLNLTSQWCAISSTTHMSKFLATVGQKGNQFQLIAWLPWQWKWWQNVKSLICHHYQSKSVFHHSLVEKNLNYNVKLQTGPHRDMRICVSSSLDHDLSQFCNLYRYEAAQVWELQVGKRLPMVPRPSIPLPQSRTLTCSAHVTALVSANDGSIMPANIALLSKRPPSSTPCKCLSDSQQIRHRQRDVK